MAEQSTKNEEVVKLPYLKGSPEYNSIMLLANAKKTAEQIKLDAQKVSKTYLLDNVEYNLPVVDVEKILPAPFGILPIKGLPVVSLTKALPSPVITPVVQTLPKQVITPVVTPKIIDFVKALPPPVIVPTVTSKEIPLVKALPPPVIVPTVTSKIIDLVKYPIVGGDINSTKRPNSTTPLVKALPPPVIVPKIETWIAKEAEKISEEIPLPKEVVKTPEKLETVEIPKEQIKTSEKEVKSGKKILGMSMPVVLIVTVLLIGAIVGTIIYFKRK